MWLERTKWVLANIGWPIAFTFWYQIIVVLYAADGTISQWALYYFHFLWIIIVCSYFSASFTPPTKCRDVEKVEHCDKVSWFDDNELTDLMIKVVESYFWKQTF